MQHRMDASLEGYAQRIDFDLLIIGQETGNRKGKHIVLPVELERTIEFAQKANIKIFVKNNLHIYFDPIFSDPFKNIIQEFPDHSEKGRKCKK